jgi:hypothetical protein
MVLGLVFSGFMIAVTITSGGDVPILLRVAFALPGLLLLVASVWPLVFALGARGVVTETSITKFYPLRLWHRTELRRELDSVDAQAITIRDTEFGEVMEQWTVVRFRRRHGQLAFKLGTIVWGRDQLLALVGTLMLGPNPVQVGAGLSGLPPRSGSR